MTRKRARGFWRPINESFNEGGETGLPKCGIPDDDVANSLLDVAEDFVDYDGTDKFWAWDLARAVQLMGDAVSSLNKRRAETILKDVEASCEADDNMDIRYDDDWRQRGEWRKENLRTKFGMDD